ncbi:hypothetical protein C9374_008483 [Naegleria lovaniensis]|uniref:Uncharacterized protein n=1 Tax=Naegleria lovaniensis TaxID=51637 RepID=A0AA88KG54_NAELO|nr:uncharacterized protein C9374_008483 [Naegleria lovaniensis]KAG2378340.1 hypothetical protein C9374_008483 [Naegleria lovaniensis]
MSTAEPIILEPNIDRNELERYAGFPCEISFIHQATKKASICSLNNSTIDFLFHDSGCSETAPFAGHYKMQNFVGCHTILAFNNHDIYRNYLNVDKANNEKASIGQEIENDEGLMIAIFQLFIQENFPVVWNQRKEYAQNYHTLLMNNNFVLSLLEEFKPTSGGLIDKSDVLAFLFAKLKALDIENEYFPKVQTVYANFLAQYSIQSVWRFAKLAFFDSNRFTQEDFKYARENDSPPWWLHTTSIFIVPRILDLIRSQDPFKQFYRVPESNDDCVLL